MTRKTKAPRPWRWRSLLLRGSLALLAVTGLAALLLLLALPLAAQVSVEVERHGGNARADHFEFEESCGETCPR